MATYKVQLADDVDGELQEPLPIGNFSQIIYYTDTLIMLLYSFNLVKQGGLIGLKRSNMEYGLYHGNLPNTKKRRYLVSYIYELFSNLGVNSFIKFSLVSHFFY